MPEQYDAAERDGIAAPFIAAVDGLSRDIPEDHREAIVRLACGISYRLIAAEMDVRVMTVLAWRRKYAHQVAALKPAVQRIATELIGNLVGDCVTIGFQVLPQLHARAKAGKVDGREFLCIVNAAQALYDLAAKIEASTQPRRDRAVTVSKDEALAAVKALKPG